MQGRVRIRIDVGISAWPFPCPESVSSVQHRAAANTIPTTLQELT
jgi:hypothetical protein